MRRIACAAWPCFLLLANLEGVFGRPTVSRTLWDVVMGLLCSSPWVPSAVPAVLPSQERCPVSQPFCKMWCNYGSAEKQGQEKGGIYYSLQIVSFKLMANYFCVVFFLLFSRFNSSVGPLYSFCSFKLGM